MQELDKSILFEARQGNLAAFEQIVLAFERPLYSYIYRLCGHRQTAEDLTQETFIKLFKNLKKIDPTGNLNSWMYTIATHTVYDFLRKKKHVQELFVIDDPESDFETIAPEQTYTIVERLQSSEEIDEALSHLKPEYKAVLLLFYRLDLPYDAIAKMMHIPIGTVKTYLHRAKISLKKYLLHRKT